MVKSPVFAVPRDAVRDRFLPVAPFSGGSNKRDLEPLTFLWILYLGNPIRCVAKGDRCPVAQGEEGGLVEIPTLKEQLHEIESSYGRDGVLFYLFLMAALEPNTVHTTQSLSQQSGFSEDHVDELMLGLADIGAIPNFELVH